MLSIQTVMQFVALPPLWTRVGSDSYICGPQPRPSNRSSCQHQAPGFVADMLCATGDYCCIDVIWGGCSDYTDPWRLRRLRIWPGSTTHHMPTPADSGQ